MDLSDVERRDLGARIEKERMRRFGTKRAAYDAAKVNSDTWDKAESGRKIRDDRLISIVRTLWPQTDGDWTLVSSVGTSDQNPGSWVGSPGGVVESGTSDSEVLRAITTMSAAIDQLVVGQRDLIASTSEDRTRSDARFSTLEDGQRELSERLAKLEKPGP